MQNSLSLWTIYEKPKDHPDKYVVRRHVIEPGKTYPTGDFALFDTLEEAREYIPEGCTDIGRYDEDDPVIVESWI